MAGQASQVGTIQQQQTLDVEGEPEARGSGITDSGLKSGRAGTILNKGNNTHLKGLLRGFTQTREDP